MANLNQYTTNNFWKFGALKKTIYFGGPRRKPFWIHLKHGSGLFQEMWFQKKKLKLDCSEFGVLEINRAVDST